MGRPKTLPDVTCACPQCGTVRTWPGRIFKWYKGRPSNKGFCSRKCAAQARINRDLMRCEQCGRLALKHVANRSKQRRRFCSKECALAASQGIRGGLDRHGYRVFNSRGRMIMEHRVVMEGVVGRELLPTETVHHKNGNRADNRPANLELWDSRHPKGQLVADKIAWCVEYLIEHGYVVSPPSP